LRRDVRLKNPFFFRISGKVCGSLFTKGFKHCGFFPLIAVLGFLSGKKSVAVRSSGETKNPAVTLTPEWS